VARVLDQAAHGLRLRATLAGAASKRGLTTAPVIAVAIERRAAPVADGACGAAGPGALSDPALGVAPCDQLWLAVTNTSSTAQDISVLYFSADFTVAPIWPTQNLANRLAPGESVTVGLQIAADSTVGLEEIWVLAVPEDKSGARVDLTRLARAETMRGQGASDPMTDWLDQRMMAADAGKTRNFSTKPAALTMIRQVVRLKPIAE
jgi:hypothetical protein